MRVAILSDIHSNLDALDAVLDEASGADAVWVLGDIVGYGAEPNEVVGRLAALDARLIAGNHDLAACGRFDARWFNPVAAEALAWTERVLAPETRDVLAALDPRTPETDPLLVHGSVVDPAAEYVTDESVASHSFDAEAFDLCFFGHTHLPSVFARAPDGRVAGRRLTDGETVRVEDGTRLMLNPGSVGQPRDRDPRASFLWWDVEEGVATIRRARYDVGSAQRKIRAAGLPEALAERLGVGR